MTAPDPTIYTQCAGSGTYQTDIAYPPGATVETCLSGRNSLVVVVGSTPSPSSPPQPSYSIESVVNSPVISADACQQRVLGGLYEEDVETAAECANALASLGIASAADPAMADSAAAGLLYADGYRCYSNSSNVFVWSAVVNPTPPRSYACREGGTPVYAATDDGNGGRRLTAQAPPRPAWTSRRAYPPPPAPFATLSEWVDASGYMYSSALHAQNSSFLFFHPSVDVRGHWEFTKTDVAYVNHPVCGVLCMVDDRVGHSTVYHGYNECRAVALTMEFFLDDDRC
jgi:hypothetical protein